MEEGNNANNTNNTNMSNNSTPLNPAEAAAQALTAASAQRMEPVQADPLVLAAESVEMLQAAVTVAERGGNGFRQEENGSFQPEQPQRCRDRRRCDAQPSGRSEGHSDRCVQEYHGGRAVKSV